jgi:hypothetical protein
MYAYEKHKEEIRREEEKIKQGEEVFAEARRICAAREARICKATADQIQEGLEMKEAFHDIRRALG